METHFVSLPGESHGQKSMMATGQGIRELDMAE